MVDGKTGAARGYAESCPMRIETATIKAIEEAAFALRGGGLVVIPTETVYGLGCNAFDEEAVKNVYEIKGRPSNNPLIVHIADFSDLSLVARDWPEITAKLAERFWPGPMTLVLPKKNSVPDITTADLDTVAVRAPAHPVMGALIRAVGPLAAPSANRSMSISPTSAAHVLRTLGGRIELILDGGPTSVGIESTVLSLVHEPPRILRPGSVSRADLADVLGAIDGGADPDADVDSESRADRGHPRLSPGTSARHYAPEAEVIVVPRGDAAALAAALRVADDGKDAGALLHTLEPPAGATSEMLPDDPQRYAAGLYAALHALDARCRRIIIEAVPETEPWTAVRDRLTRASA